MFCSTSPWVHLTRGVGAASLIWTAFFFGLDRPLILLAALGGAIYLMRGCPMCWLFGLLGTLARRKGGTTVSKEIRS
jgi:hypothetical protein